MIRKKNKKGADLPKSSSYLQAPPSTATPTSMTEKSMPLTDTELFAYLFSCIEFGGFEDREQELKALCYILFRENR